MRKVIAAFNMTLDGNCDHTAGIPDEELHRHYEELLKSADIALYGRTTYHLMEFWKDLVQNPSGQKDMDDFALSMDRIPKLVFSRTLKEVDWHSARLAQHELGEEVRLLKEQPGGDILVGSRSLITSLINLGLVDEFQLTIFPVVAGKGLTLLDAIADRTLLKLTKTKTFTSGAVTMYYTFE
ncbi:Dihydrofolate reductase [Dyadobacter soli]|uniref:Dihydrofolate reductase n=1 Tax=Dyadobacter soli TaxID=659014 RepID=A0A1G7D5M4_9BACT|nr:dihydrofolate reductase family protein [Dyadobacter soli]SDE46045.1 Dihydrofolate reductase [Dyadobacter soli]